MSESYMHVSGMGSLLKLLERYVKAIERQTELMEKNLSSAEKMTKEKLE